MPFGIFVQVLDDILQAVLRFIFTGDIGEFDPVRRLDEDLRIRFPHAELHRAGASHVLHQPLIHVVADAKEDEDRQYPGEQRR